MELQGVLIEVGCKQSSLVEGLPFKKNTVGSIPTVYTKCKVTPDVC